MKTKIVYCIVSNDEDIYLEQAWVSIYTLRRHNPDAEVILLVDKDMSKGDLHKASGLSSSTMTKLRKGEDVSMEALRKICICLGCNIGDIVEFVDESK